MLNDKAIEVIESIDAETLSALKLALEDGAALAIAGIDDADQNAVEDAHFFAKQMIERIKAADKNCDKENGFFWLSDAESDNLFQMCCDENGLIDPKDTGAAWGLCGDYNLGIYKSGDIVRMITNEILSSLPDGDGDWIECEVELMSGETVVGRVRKVDGGYEWARDQRIGTNFVADDDKRDLPEWAYNAITSN